MANSQTSRLFATLSRSIIADSLQHQSGFAFLTQRVSVGQSWSKVLSQQIRRISGSTASSAVTELTMPALSPTMKQGNIAEWKVQVGQQFSAGDILADIETDKANMGWESQEDGIMAKIILPAGTNDITVGTLVALTVDEESELENIDSYKSSSGPAAPTSDKGNSEPASATTSASPADGPSKAFPAHEVWTMPALSPTMKQGNIAKWYKQVGDEISAGDGLVEVETDKATMMWESVQEGYLAKILAPDGAQEIPVGQPVAVVVEDSDMVPAFSSYTVADAGAGGSSPPVAASPPAESAPPPPPPAPSPPTTQAAPLQTPAPSVASGRVISTPYARRLAREAGVSVAAVKGTGPNGRIVAADVTAAIASGVTAQAPVAEAPGAGGLDAHFTEESIKQIQKITAKRLLESKTSVPHYYVSYECKMDALLGLRASLNKQLADTGSKISVNDFMIKASGAALKQVPDVNSSWHGDYIRRYHNVDVSIAVQTPAGLMVPIVRDADLKGLQQISSEVKTLAAKAREGKLTPADYTGGTFTVSNLGMYGVTSFCPIINPPQAAILGCGATVPQVVLGQDGVAREEQIMTVTISCDHRVVDGAVAATWLQAFRKYIENPTLLML